MEQRISFITLGVTDLARAQAFYETLVWKPLPQSTDSPGSSGERVTEALGAAMVPGAEAQGQNRKRGGQAAVRPPDPDHTADGRVLPIGWKSYWSASQQRPFYQHKATKRVVWVRTFSCTSTKHAAHAWAV